MSTSQELKIIGPEDLQGAELILVTNKGYVTKYQKKFDALIKKAEREGVKLSPETDKEINEYLVSNKTCLKKMEEDRKPFTKKLDEVVSLFTAEENKLKKDLYTALQAKRDASAKAWADEEKKQLAADQLKLDQEKERVSLFADVEQQIRDRYTDELNSDKSELLNAFEGATAETIDSVVDLLTTAKGEFTEDRFTKIVVKINPQFLEVEEAKAIAMKANEGKLAKIQPYHTGEIRAYCNHLLSLIPDRRAEIAKGEESKAAAELRKTEEEQLAEQKKTSEATKEATISNGIANAVMDININQTARTSMMPAAKAIESYSITVVKREGWAEIRSDQYVC